MPEHSRRGLELPEFSQSDGAGTEALRRRKLREVVGEQLAVEEQNLSEGRGGGRLGEDLVGREAPARGVAAAAVVVGEVVGAEAAEVPLRDEDARETLSDALELDGFSVREAEDGLALMSDVVAEKPDAIVLDVALSWI